MKIARYMRTLLLAAVVLAVPAASFAGIFISVGIAPPPLPVYEQPPIPGDGYLWTPGYWAWGPDGYFWVPGTWCEPPRIGFLWTPGYWGWNNGFYNFNAGYWGPHIGFYGGVNYGFGYGGVGFEGGYWDHDRFAYNRTVNNITNVHVTNVYNRTVINNTTVNRTSYNGGTGGVQARPTAQEQTALHENHVQPTVAQTQHINQAQNNPQLRAAVNGGKPAIAATARPGDFHAAVPARQAGGQVNTAVYKAAANNGGKLPSGMRDPGGNVAAYHPGNANTQARPANTYNGANGGNRPPQGYNGAERPTQNTPNAEQNRPYAQQNQPRPYNEQARPETQQPHPQPQQPHPQMQQPHPQEQPPHESAPHESAPHESHPKR